MPLEIISQVATVLALVIVVSGILYRHLKKSFNISLVSIVEDMQDNTRLDIEKYIKDVDSKVTSYEAQATLREDNTKRNSRQHLKNEIKNLEDDFARDNSSQNELMRLQLDTIKKSISDLSEAVLRSQEQTMNAQLDLSSVQARLDVIQRAINLKPTGK